MTAKFLGELIQVGECPSKKYNEDYHPPVDFSPALEPAFGECIFNGLFVILRVDTISEKLRDFFIRPSLADIAHILLVKGKLDDKLQAKQYEK